MNMEEIEKVATGVCYEDGLEVEPLHYADFIRKSNTSYVGYLTNGLGEFKATELAVNHLVDLCKDMKFPEKLEFMKEIDLLSVKTYEPKYARRLKYIIDRFEVSEYLPLLGRGYFYSHYEKQAIDLIHRRKVAKTCNLDPLAVRAEGAVNLKTNIKEHLAGMTKNKGIFEYFHKELGISYTKTLNLVVRARKQGLRPEDLKSLPVLEKVFGLDLPAHTNKGIKISYSGLVKAYFGIDLETGANKPRLSKQLKVQGITATQKELQAFAELEEWLKSSFVDRVREDLYLDTSNFEIPYSYDFSAIGNSCHCEGGAGAATPFILKSLRYSMLKIYSTDGKTMKPFARAYFYKEGKDLAHAGMYSEMERCKDNLETTAYGLTSLLLAVLFNRKIDDFKDVKSMTLFAGRHYLNKDGHKLPFWANMSTSSKYKKLGTRPDILNTEYIIEGDECPWNDVYLSDFKLGDSEDELKTRFEMMM